MSKVKVAVLGATGFTGEKLVKILLGHPKAEVAYLASQTPKPVAYSQLFPVFKGKTSLSCEPLDVKKAAKTSDIIFLSLPHTVSMRFAPYLVGKHKAVIDLSADYRLKDTAVYRKYYGACHKDKANLRKAVYGLAEINKKRIKKSRLIANPGCYPTSVILALYPLLKEGVIESKVIADSKSAISGAGRKTAAKSGCVNNFWAYKAFAHQHAPEIISALESSSGKKVKLFFVPQVASFDAGIYSTVYVSFKKKVTEAAVKKLYHKYYRNCPFVRLSKGMPVLKKVAGTNFCDIGFVLGPDKKTGLVVSAIDNLIKGAAGSAVQNMNIICGFSETEGLL